MEYTVEQVISDLFSSWNAPLSDVAIGVMLVKAGIEPGTVYNTDTATATDKAILAKAVQLLPKADVQEGDMSIKFDKTAIKDYIANQSIALGLTGAQPTVIDASNRW